MTRALLFIGIALLLFGTAYALQLAFQHDLIGPRARVALGLIAGIAVTFAGSRLRKNTYRYLGEGLIALGTGVLYLSLWAAAGPYHFISSFVGCIAMFAVTIALAALAYARQSERIALLGLVGGYITPLLLGYDPSEQRFAARRVPADPRRLDVSARADRAIPTRRGRRVHSVVAVRQRLRRS